MADLLDFAPVRVFTSNAAPGAGYIARFYQSGTTTPVTVYSDSSLTTPLGSSATADASGVFPAVWSTGGSIKCTIETPVGAIVHTVDPVQSVSAGAAASQISFSPTVALPQTNVQAAIEAAAATAASGFTPFGLGVTGSVALLANIDATNIASGQYRFDGTTTGTYPTGVAAADTGAVVMVRETAGSGWMVMYHDTTDRVWFRRMNASTWGTWRENLTVNQPVAQGDLFFRGATNVQRLALGTANQVLRVNAGATAPEWATPASLSPYTLLGTINTTSGSTQSLTSLVLTSYKFLQFTIDGVSFNGAAALLIDGLTCSDTTAGATGALTGSLTLDLFNGIFMGGASTTGPLNSARSLKTSYTTATTTITFSASAGAFDAGSIRVYGVA